jgi:hypothetical protein
MNKKYDNNNIIIASRAYFLHTNIDVNTVSTTIVGIVVPTIIDTTPPETEVDIARSTIIDTASPSIAISLRSRPPSTPPQAW